jgi:hypothetical protein
VGSVSARARSVFPRKAEAPPAQRAHVCSFCGCIDLAERPHGVAGRVAWICGDCVTKAAELLGVGKRASREDDLLRMREAAAPFVGADAAVELANQVAALHVGAGFYATVLEAVEHRKTFKLSPRALYPANLNAHHVALAMTRAWEGT